MKNTFTRECSEEMRKVEFYMEQVDKLYADMKELVSGGVPEQEVLDYIRALITQTQRSERGNLLMWTMEEPSHMPSDARVDFAYRPTYIASGMIAYSLMHYASVREIPGIYEIAREALEACTGRGFMGSGYEREEGMLHTLDIFGDCGMEAFVEAYPELCPKFTELFRLQVQFLADELSVVGWVHAWGGRQSPEKAEKVLQKYPLARKAPDLLFVYGTLMHGQPANHMLAGCECLGRYLLHDYAMYDLGSFPGIIQDEKEAVEGEVYRITPDMIPALDRYEGEGSLYTRRRVRVVNRDALVAYAYIYNGSPEGKPMRESWGASESDMVWYAAYGSNLSAERFRCYIQGGTFRQNGKTYPGCRDKSLWQGEFTLESTGHIYFGNESPSWNGKGVAFFDPRGYGSALMRCYKITREQFHDIQRQEGASDSWYGRIVTLGLHDDGCPVVTLTSEDSRPENLPDRAYTRVMRYALANEMGFEKEEVESYMREVRDRSKKRGDRLLVR